MQKYFSVKIGAIIKHSKIGCNHITRPKGVPTEIRQGSCYTSSGSHDKGCKKNRCTKDRRCGCKVAKIGQISCLGFRLRHTHLLPCRHLGDTIFTALDA